MNTRIERRTFLRGVGATLALPWLEIMTPTVRAAQRQLPPCRFVTFFLPKGVFPKAWNVSVTAQQYGAEIDSFNNFSTGTFNGLLA